MRTRRNNSSSRGLWIAFLGPDGVGKSAVIQELQRQLQDAFGEVILFHFRPGFRRQAAGRPAVTCPHAQRPRGLMLSLGKLIYWLIDCWYGYLFVIRPGKQSHDLVIFDRYYPDILIDPLRYRLPRRCQRFARWVTTWAPRPDLYVLLDAPSEIVQQRKSELPLAESHRQRVAYLKMFERIDHKLLVNASYPVDEIARNIRIAVGNLYPELRLTVPESFPPCLPLELIDKILRVLPPGGTCNLPSTLYSVSGRTGPRWIFPSGGNLDRVLSKWSPYRLHSRLLWRGIVTLQKAGAVAWSPRVQRIQPRRSARD